MTPNPFEQFETATLTPVGSCYDIEITAGPTDAGIPLTSYAALIENAGGRFISVQVKYADAYVRFDSETASMSNGMVVEENQQAMLNSLAARRVTVAAVTAGTTPHVTMQGFARTNVPR